MDRFEFVIILKLNIDAPKLPVGPVGPVGVGFSIITLY